MASSKGELDMEAGGFGIPPTSLDTAIHYLPEQGTSGILNVIRGP